MDWSMFGRWEWLLIEIIVLGLAVAELMLVRRSLRRDRDSGSGQAAGSGNTPAD